MSLHCLFFYQCASNSIHFAEKLVFYFGTDFFLHLLAAWLSRPIFIHWLVISPLPGGNPQMSVAKIASGFHFLGLTGQDSEVWLLLAVNTMCYCASLVLKIWNWAYFCDVMRHLEHQCNKEIQFVFLHSDLQTAWWNINTKESQVPMMQVNG